MERNDKLRVFSNSKGFVFHDGKLQEVELLRTDFKYSNAENGYRFYTTVTKSRMPDGSIKKLIGYVNVFFDSVEKYEKGEPAKMREANLTFDGKFNPVIRDIFSGKKRNYKWEYWTFDSLAGTAVEDKLLMDDFYYDYGKGMFGTDELPDCEIYDSKQEALAFNTYKVVEEDGTEYERDGIGKLLMLDDDQKILLERFQNIMQEMHDNGIRLIASVEEHLGAYNTRHVDDLTLDYEATAPGVDNGELYEYVERYAEVFKVPHQIEIWGEDYNIFALRHGVKKNTEDEA